MKLLKKSVALFLAVVMAVAVLVVPASAASSEWVGRFKKIRSYKDLQLSSQVRLRGAEYPFGL